MLIDKHEDLQEKLAKELRDPNADEQKVMVILKKQQKAKKKIIKFLKIELGIETVFQIAGRVSGKIRMSGLDRDLCWIKLGTDTIF